MKKLTKKLTLNRETLRNLNPEELTGAVAGIEQAAVDHSVQSCNTCEQSICGSCSCGRVSCQIC